MQDYQKLIASAQIEFEGGTYTISQLSPFKNDPDDARRLAAWQAEGGWYKAHQTELDEIYDKLVKLRDAMGRKLGYDGYTELGYYRMGRNCYTKQDVEKFRAAVIKYVVPVAASVYEAQAKRLGKTYPMTFADNALGFRSGNPKPCGTPDDILAQGKRFYEALSPKPENSSTRCSITSFSTCCLPPASGPAATARALASTAFRLSSPTSTARSTTLRS